MKITLCPNCQHPIVVNPSDMNPQHVFSCGHCGYSDYAYVFLLRHKDSHTPRKTNEMTVADVIRIIDQQLTEQNITCIDINGFIYDLHNRCKYLSPVVISKLINSVIECHPQEPNQTYNETLFVKYEQERISLDEIYEKIKELESLSILNEQFKGSADIEDSSKDIQTLRRELQVKEEIIDSWIKEYEQLIVKYENVKLENETLKRLTRK